MQQCTHLKSTNRFEINLGLEKLLKNFVKPKQYTIPIFIPHKGCKNECIFCNQRKISGSIDVPSLEVVDNIISEKLYEIKGVDKNIKKEIAFFGGSFTGLDISEQISYLEVANKYINSGDIESIRVSTRPDYISVPILDIMKKYNVGTIELGIQSMDNNVLKISKRGHTAKDVIRAVRLIQLYNISFGAQIMIGLPESTMQSELYTIEKVLNLKPSQLRIYPVYVIFPSELYDMYKLGKYIPLTVDEAIYRTSEVIKKCTDSDVKIIRVGLQSTDEITQTNKDIVGPVCDNIAEYAIASIVKEEIERKLVNFNLSNSCKNYITILSPKRYASYVVGPKRINKDYFEKKYNACIKIKNI